MYVHVVWNCFLWFYNKSVAGTYNFIQVWDCENNVLGVIIKINNAFGLCMCVTSTNFKAVTRVGSSYPLVRMHSMGYILGLCVCYCYSATTCNETTKAIPAASVLCRHGF